MALLCGDLNMSVHEDPILKRWATEGPWHDCYAISEPAMQSLHTRHPDRGSRIDFIFAALNAFHLASNYLASNYNVTKFKTVCFTFCGACLLAHAASITVAQNLAVCDG